MTNLQIPKTVRMVISDFDGIMTDNCVYIDENLSISRKLNFKDIMAVSLLRKAGIQVVFISGEKNPVIDLLAEKFDNVVENHQNIRIKIDVLKALIEKYDLKQDEYLFMGDDINDIACLELASVKITVPNSTKAVKNVEGIQVTTEQGGSGAFREVVDCLLSS